jgi:hypothetical protein
VKFETGSSMRGPDAVCIAKISSRAVAATKKLVSVNETQARTGASGELRSGKTSHSPSPSMFADGGLTLLGRTEESEWSWRSVSCLHQRLWGTHK